MRARPATCRLAYPGRTKTLLRRRSSRKPNVRGTTHREAQDAWRFRRDDRRAILLRLPSVPLHMLYDEVVGTPEITCRRKERKRREGYW